MTPLTVRFIFNNSDSEKMLKLDGGELHLKPFEMKYIYKQQ